MVLFMRRENERVQYFAAGNGSVIAQVGIDKPGAVF